MHQWLFDLELYDDEGDQEHGRRQSELDDERRLEPVVLVAFLQNRLQRRKADGHGNNAGPIALLEQGQLHRLLLKGEVERNYHHQARRGVDEEDRLPAIILGEIAADRRANRRGEGDRERKQRQAERLLRFGQAGQHHGEGHRNEHAAGKTLQTAQRNHRA